jgi:hypothetical protein
MSVLPEVQQTFLDAFGYTQEFDATVLSLTFSDGSVDGRITLDITGLLITDQSRAIHTHSHGLNIVGEIESVLFMFYASQVPSGAQIYSKQMIDISGTKYNLETVVLEYGLYTLTMRLLGMH